LNLPETLVYNILGNLAVRVGLIVLPIVYAAYRLYRLNRNSERIGRVNEAADRFSKIHYYDFQGKDPEGKKADAFLAARSFFDTNRRKVSSTEDAIVLLERELRNGSIGTYTFEARAL
jgi:hypothetical protein